MLINYPNCLIVQYLIDSQSHSSHLIWWWSLGQSMPRVGCWYCCWTSWHGTPLWWDGVRGSSMSGSLPTCANNLTSSSETWFASVLLIRASGYLVAYSQMTSTYVPLSGVPPGEWSDYVCGYHLKWLIHYWQRDQWGLPGPRRWGFLALLTLIAILNHVLIQAGPVEPLQDTAGSHHGRNAIMGRLPYRPPSHGQIWWGRPWCHCFLPSVSIT